MTDRPDWFPTYPPMLWADLVEEYGLHADYPGITGDIGEECVCRMAGSYAGVIWTPAYARELYADSWQAPALSAAKFYDLLWFAFPQTFATDDDVLGFNFDDFQDGNLIPKPNTYAVCGDWLYDGIWQWLLVERASETRFWAREPYGTELFEFPYPVAADMDTRIATRGYKGRTINILDVLLDWRAVEAFDKADQDMPENVQNEGTDGSLGY